MTPQEAKNIMDDMVKNSSGFCLPAGFTFAIYVPVEIANLARIYYEKSSAFNNMNGKFAAGEVFYYMGVRCFAA